MLSVSKRICLSILPDASFFEISVYSKYKVRLNDTSLTF